MAQCRHIVFGGILACATLLGGSQTTAAAGFSMAPPSPSASNPRWELRFETVQPLRLVQVDGEWYWIMTYLATNRTNEDLIFVPNAILATDAGDILRDGQISFDTTRKILDLIGNPLLKSKNEIIGQIKQGREHAEEGLLVWKAGELTEVRDVRVFIGGLSSETQVVENPATGEDLVVRKHLALEFDCPGDPRATPSKAVYLRKEHWIMR